MNKLLTLGGVSLFMLSAASCSSDLDQPGVSGDGNVHFSVQLPEGMRTRAFADGTTAKNLKYAVYQNGALVSQGSATLSDKAANVNIDLASGGTYDFVFWAEADNSPYTFSAEGRLVTVNYAGMNGNNDNGDAFFYIENGVKVDGALTRSVTLSRPCAQLNIGTSDLNNASVATTYQEGVYTSVTAEACTTLDLTDGSAANPVQVTLPATLPASAQETFPVAGGYRYLSMAYMLVGDEGSVSDLTINSYTSAASQTPAHTVKVPNAPLKRNFRTNLYGQLLSSTTNWNISIDSEFGGGTGLSVWDGSTEAPVVDDAAKTVTVSSAAQLAGFAQAVNGGTQYSGYTVTLTSDIDLAGKPWTPAGNVASYPSITFSGTFDGDGHTIYNLNANASGTTYATAGLFGSLTGKVQNLNLVGGKVNSTHYAGAICGYSSSNVGMEISGCTVEDFTIVSVPEMFNGEYDNGDKVGGIVGYMDGGDKVSDCVVRNTTVKGYRDIGGVAGYCNNGGPISGCTVEDVTLIQDFENGYKPENDSKVEGHIGEIFGYGSNTGSGNTFTNVTITYANRAGGLAAQLAAGGNVTISEATDLVDLTDLNPAKPLNLLLMAPVTTMNIGTTLANPTAITIEVADGVAFPQFRVADPTQSVRNLTIKGTPTSSQPLVGFRVTEIGNQPKEMTNVTLSGVHLDTKGVYMAHSNGTVVENMVIEGCNMTNLIEPAVSFQAGGAHGNVTIKDNTVSFSPSAVTSANGLYLLGFSGPLTVTGNTIVNAPYHGVFVMSATSGAVPANAAATTLINGNTIVNPKKDGVKVQNYNADVTVSGNMISAGENGIRVVGFSADNTFTVTGNTINTQNMVAFDGSEPWGILFKGSDSGARPVINVSGNKKVGVTEHWFELTGVTPAASSNYANPF